MRVVFMGSPDFSVPVLAALRQAGHEVICVYSQPPRPAGRGHKETPCPVHAAALAQGLLVRTPKSLRNAEAQTEFAALNAEVAVVAAYGLILPKPVLDAPRLGCVNVHASLLPRWRGAAPIQRAILAGDTESGVTIMRMDEGLDTGAMLLAEAVPITPATTGQSLHDALSALGTRLIIPALAELDAGTLAAHPQPEDGITYAAKLSKDEGRLDFSRSAEDLERAVRAFTPWPGAWFDLAGERVKVLAAETADHSGPPGIVLDDSLTIACGAGAFRPLKVQRAGKAALETGAFLRGFAVPAGTRL